MRYLMFFIMATCIVISLPARAWPEDIHIHHEKQHEDLSEISEEEIEDVENVLCPVLGGKVDKNVSYLYQDKRYYFCCPDCIEEFKKDPEKYLSKIEEINLEAYQFGFSPELIEVKKDDIVRLVATSRDVTHGIYIKEYDINVPVKKGEIKKIEFIANQAGEFDILCSVYCGRGHHNMKAKLVVKE